MNLDVVFNTILLMKMDSESGDLHTPGRQGEILGSFFVEETEVYFVLFEGDPAGTLITKSKIILL